MPANLRPDYLAAEKRYRQAVTADDQMAALREMLAVIPKHKGTEKLQAELKARVAQLRRTAGRRAGPVRQRPEYVIERQGAGQIPVLGPPNAGKSALVRALTGVELEVAAYPHTTQRPAPAMMPFEDTAIQLVDTPAVSSSDTPPWVAELVLRGDALLIAVDLSAPEAWEEAVHLDEMLAGRGIELWHPDTGTGSEAGESEGQGLRLTVPTLIAGTHAEAAEAARGAAEVGEAIGGRLPLFPVSVPAGQGQEALRGALFRSLRVVRAYSKEPGRPPDRGHPWLLPEGSTVLELARKIHKDLAATFRFARLWGAARFEGQRVGAEHVLADGDVVEIHGR